VTPRTRGALLAGAGAVLAVAGYLLVRAFQGWAFDHELDVERLPFLRYVGAVPALGLALGLALVYVGATRLAFGERAAGIDLGRVTWPGFAYVLGFAAVLVGAAWVVVDVLEWDPFGG
jgi:hypothetical protein